MLAATLTVGWLTHGVLKAERLASQMQQQALLDNKLRLALWRLDSVAAPLIAVETLNSKYLPPNPNAPQLASRLVRMSVEFRADERWYLVESVRSQNAVSRKPVGHAAARTHESVLAALTVNQAAFRFLVVSTGESDADRGFATTQVTASNPLNEYLDWPSVPSNRPGQQLAANKNALRMNARTSANANLNQAQQADDEARDQLTQQVQQLAVNQIRSQSQGGLLPTTQTAAEECLVGPFTPLWVDDELLLARRIGWQKNSTTVIECRVLDWPEWERLLTSQIADLFPNATLVPITESSAVPSAESADFAARMLSLPLRLKPQPVILEPNWPQAILIAWSMLMLVALAIGWLLWQTQSLSERRAAFVSAVTHELRTPLTTFRLYTEMLSDGLVPDVEQQQSYFRTLAREANRLTHLVENVLSFARLERGRTTARNESITLGALFDRCSPRLAQRVAETPLQWTPELAESARAITLTTNITAIEQVLFNLVDNACKYAVEASDSRLLFNATASGGEVILSVRDFGPGLSDSARKTLFAAFEKSSAQAAETAPGIGLGLSLSKRLARDLGGDLKFASAVTPGVQFELHLPAC